MSAYGQRGLTGRPRSKARSTADQDQGQGWLARRGWCCRSCRRLRRRLPIRSLRQLLQRSPHAIGSVGGPAPSSTPRCRAANTAPGVSLLAIGCEAVVKRRDSPSQESRSDFIASKLSYRKNPYIQIVIFCLMRANSFAKAMDQTTNAVGGAHKKAGRLSGRLVRF